jgi:hypothetical protein
MDLCDRDSAGLDGDGPFLPIFGAAASFCRNGAPEVMLSETVLPDV